MVVAVVGFDALEQFDVVGHKILSVRQQTCGEIVRSEVDDRQLRFERMVGHHPRAVMRAVEGLRVAVGHVPAGHFRGVVAADAHA